MCVSSSDVAVPPTTVFLSLKDCVASARLDNMDASMQAGMLGFPQDIWDTSMGLPLIRHGHFASHVLWSLPLRYPDGSKGGVGGFIDMACFPGSSGSPVFVIPSPFSLDGSINLTGAPVWQLIGILSYGPTSGQQNHWIPFGKTGERYKNIDHTKELAECLADTAPDVQNLRVRPPKTAATAAAASSPVEASTSEPFTQSLAVFGADPPALAADAGEGDIDGAPIHLGAYVEVFDVLRNLQSPTYWKQVEPKEWKRDREPGTTSPPRATTSNPGRGSPP